MNDERSINPNPDADFTPALGDYKELKPFRYWCQKVLPLVYDDSLSYYELLCKVVDYLNKTMSDVNTLSNDVEKLHTAYNQLQSYVNNYFSTLDVQEEINIKLDEMAKSGELTALIKKYVDPLINEQNNKINTLEKRMDTFSALPAGSTSGDAELVDIRVPYNLFNGGDNYPTAGDSVRGQVEILNTLSNIFSNSIVVNYNTQGLLTGSGFYKSGIANSNVSEYIEVNGNDTIVVFHMYGNKDETASDSDSINIVAFYDSNQNYVSHYLGNKGFNNAFLTVPPNAKYARFTKLIDTNWGSDNKGICLINKAKQNVLNNEKTIEVIKNGVGEKIETNIEGYLTADGAFHSSSAGIGVCSDYVIIGNTDKVVFFDMFGNYTQQPLSQVVGIVCYYDMEKKFISSVYDYNGLCSGIDVPPTNAKFVRVCHWLNNNDFNPNGFVYLFGKRKKHASKLTILESINKPFDFTNKHINGFGDSIMVGVTSPALVKGVPFIEIFSKHVNAKLYNFAVSGSTFSVDPNWEAGSICEKVMNVTPSDIIDYLFIAGGTNDYNQSRPIGKLTDKNMNTVCGALNNMCEHIEKHMSDRIVIFITPIPYTEAYYKREGYTNALGYNLEDYSRAIYEVATLHGFNVVDGYTLGMPYSSGEWVNSMCDDTDGCHPTQLGQKLYGRSLAGKLL